MANVAELAMAFIRGRRGNKVSRIQRNRKERGMTVIGMLLLIVVIGFMLLIAMKVIPMYMEYYKIKATVASIRKEPQLAQMSAADLQRAIQNRFDSGYVERLQARDLKIRNDAETRGRVIELIYDHEQELFYKLYVVLKVDEIIPLTPN
ncbi:MAG TPA: hypothetical protein DCS21_10670 [Gammaproteobacteria bacterium]|nr:hypothetical protein [Gammaproteobacteria bacterium]